MGAYEEARRQGHIDAMFNLGTLYKKQGNMSKAVELYEEARRQGHTGAIFNLNVGDALPQSSPPLPQSTPPDGWTSDRETLLHEDLRHGIADLSAILLDRTTTNIHPTICTAKR